MLPDARAAGSETRASKEKAIAAHIVPTAVVILPPRLSRKLFALLVKDPDLVMTEAYSRRLGRYLVLVRWFREFKKTPPISRGSFLTVETRGIDVPSKDGGCRDWIWIFRL